MEHQGLPVELLDGMFTQLYENDPSNLLPLAPVSHGIYMLVTPLIYRTITIDVSEKESSERNERVYKPLVERLLAGPSVCALVRELRVVHQSDIYETWLYSSEVFASLMQRLKQLEMFRWEVNHPSPGHLFRPVLQAGSNSRFRFHLNIDPDYHDENLSAYENFLGQACHTLCSLRICIPCDGYGETKTWRIKSKLFSALKNCTNLRSLFTYSYGRQNDVINGPRLAVETGDTLPSLRELSIADDSETFRPEDLEIWGANGRWSNLQKITFRDHQLLDGIHGCEKTLKSINLIEVSEGFQQSLADLCSRVDQLRELRVGGECFCVPVAALQKCGHSLKSLALRGHGEHCRIHTNEVPPEDLQLIHDSCPILSSMAMSIGRQPHGCAEWQNYLSILAQFSHLTELSLHVDRHPSSDEMTLAQVDKADMVNTENVFRYLIKHSREQQLKSLTIYCGPQLSDWDDPAGNKDTSDTIFHASSTTGDGQERKITVRQIQGELQGGTKVEDSPSYMKPGQKEAEAKTVDYLNSVPPAILSRMISALGGQADNSSGIPNLDYGIRTGGLQSKLAAYEANWKASNGILPLLEWQLQKRKEQGWDLWEMPLMQGEIGKEGFLYDRLRANKENGETGGAYCGGDIEGRKERLSTESGNTVLGFSQTKQRPRARSI